MATKKKASAGTASEKKTTAKTKSASSPTGRSKTSAPSSAGKGSAGKGAAKVSRSSGASSHTSHATTDHEEIRQWAEERGGKPACVKGTGDANDTGIIRIDFPTGPEPSLQEISWDDWFEKFDENSLALVLQESTADGEQSRFNKIVSRDSVEEKKSAKTSSRTRTAGGGS